MNILYMMDGCPICAQAIQHLNEKDIPFKRINILEKSSARNELKELIGEVYTPVLIHEKGVSIGRNIMEMTETNSS